MRLTYHPLVQREATAILRHYDKSHRAWHDGSTKLWHTPRVAIFRRDSPTGITLDRREVLLSVS